jgi:hypothetical protein
MSYAFSNNTTLCTSENPFIRAAQGTLKEK